MAARVLILVCILAGIGWSIYCHIYLTEWHTTSLTAKRLVTACPAIGMAIVLVAFCVFQDALPGVEKWIVLLLTVAGICIGHCTWSLP